jgi:hypothetical protein
VRMPRELFSARSRASTLPKPARGGPERFPEGPHVPGYENTPKRMYDQRERCLRGSGKRPPSCAEPLLEQSVDRGAADLEKLGDFRSAEACAFISRTLAASIDAGRPLMDRHRSSGCLISVTVSVCRSRTVTSALGWLVLEQGCGLARKVFAVTMSARCAVDGNLVAAAGIHGFRGLPPVCHLRPSSVALAATSSRVPERHRHSAFPRASCRRRRRS